MVIINNSHFVIAMEFKFERCWIGVDKPGWRFGVWYGPLLVMFIYVVVMYVWIVKTLYSQRSSEFYQREAEEVKK
jgi:hypothetical protein